MSDERLNSILGWSYGVILLVILALVARGLALGMVEQKSSFGLDGILAALTILATNWGQWVVRQVRGSKSDDAP